MRSFWGFLFGNRDQREIEQQGTPSLISYDRLTNDSTKSLTEISNLKACLDRKMEMLKLLDAKHAALLNETESITKESDASTQKTEDVRTDCREIDHRIKQLERKAEEGENSKRILKRSLDKLKQDSEDLQAQISEELIKEATSRDILTVELDRQKDYLKKFADAQASKAKIAKETISQSDTLSGLQKRLEEVQKELAGIHHQKSECEKVQFSLKDEIKVAMDHLASTESEITLNNEEIQKCSKAIEDIKQKIRETQTTAQQHEQFCKEILKELECMEQKKVDLQETFGENTKKRNALRYDISSVQSEQKTVNEEYFERVSEMDALLSDIDTIMDEQDGIDREIIRINEQRNEILDSISECQQQLTEVANTLGELGQKDRLNSEPDLLIHRSDSSLSQQDSPDLLSNNK